MQPPVYSQPDDGFVSLRFDVDIASPLLERVLQEKINRFDYMLVRRIQLVLGHNVNELFEVAQILG